MDWTGHFALLFGLMRRLRFQVTMIQIGVWQKQTSMDRSLFEANRGLMYQGAASSIKHKKEGSIPLSNNEKRSLTKGRLLEEELFPMDTGRNTGLCFRAQSLFGLWPPCEILEALPIIIVDHM